MALYQRNDTGWHLEMINVNGDASLLALMLCEPSTQVGIGFLFAAQRQLPITHLLGTCQLQTAQAPCYCCHVPVKVLCTEIRGICPVARAGEC